jgi:SAM-dependent methyltransferase
MEDYYQENHEQYYDQTFSIDPTSFLIPLARCLHPSSTILDLGCGSGRDMRWFKDRGFRPTGFELSHGLAVLASKYSECPVVEGNFECYDFSGMGMDALLLVGSLVHVPHNRFPGILSNIVQALKPGGYMLVTMKEGQNATKDAEGRVFYLWRDEELRIVFERLNLTVVEFSRQVSKIRESDMWLGYVLIRVM